MVLSRILKWFGVLVAALTIFFLGGQYYEGVLHILLPVSSYQPVVESASTSTLSTTGTFVAFGPGTMEIKFTDGTTHTFYTGSTTKAYSWTPSGQKAKDVQPGDKVFMLLPAGQRTVEVINIMNSPLNLMSGKVTSINSDSSGFTIKLADGSSKKVSVSPTATFYSYKAAGEVAKGISDVTVGGTVNVEGLSKQDGTFLANRVVINALGL